MQVDNNMYHNLGSWEKTFLRGTSYQLLEAWQFIIVGERVVFDDSPHRFAVLLVHLPGTVPR
jgi:hypothetical protein